jgi:hypothetical protein
MGSYAGGYANQLRLELGLRNHRYARGRAHVESYGNPPIVVYEPEDDTHGNFFEPAYRAIMATPEWARRFDKVHSQAARSLPKPQLDLKRRWRELDSSMSSDALLMNVFCTPGVADSPVVRNALGVDVSTQPVLGWKARVPFKSGRFDRTEVDMRFGPLLVEAKLTEANFQMREARIVEAYRGFDEIFERDLLPRVELTVIRRKEAVEFPEAFSQEFESVIDVTMPLDVCNDLRENSPSAIAAEEFNAARQSERGYLSYQLIRNVLAAHAADCSFCVLHDERRPDLREDWFRVMAAVKSAEMRTRMKVLTWQELAAFLPDELQQFLDTKYGIVAPGKTPFPVADSPTFD